MLLSQIWIVLLIETIYFMVLKELLLYNLLDKYRWLGGSCCFHFYTEDGSSSNFKFLYFFHERSTNPLDAQMSKLHV